MGRLDVATPRFNFARVTYFGVIASVFALSALSGRSQEPAGSADLHGTIRDSQGKPIASATVHLSGCDRTPALNAQTDGQGNYRFSALGKGVYSLRADATGFSEAVIPAIFLGVKESKSVDLTLEPTKETLPPVSPQGPAFFDQPQFTVSGVTDTTNLGGHGSDTVVRTRESLARETASLSKAPTVTDTAAAAALEASLRKRAEREPSSFEANHEFGQLLIRNGKARVAMPYLERAAHIDPADYGNSFDLALANSLAGNYDSARQQAEVLLVGHNTAELHHLLADVQEKLGNSLEAVREFQRAAALDPNESYLFDWGSELLLHHAPQPAIEVFNQGNRRFPRSTRMLLGLGAAYFAQANYDQAAQRISQATDIVPDDSTPYLFLGKIAQLQSPLSDEVVERLGRFVRLHSESAAANYYYSVALWRRRKTSRDSDVAAKVESLLGSATRLDPKYGAAYLQLGIVDCERGNFPKAIADFQQAVQASPDMEEAHYRLGQAYRETGQSEKAKAELRLYNKVAKESAQRAERERRELRQFLYTLRDQPASQVQ
jgi:tetratricopeptide (TPR) repeat protein